MNWPIFFAGIAITCFLSLMFFVIDRAIPNYVDPDEIPPWFMMLLFGVVAAFALGWWFP